MREKVKIGDKVASAVLNAASEKSGSDNAKDAPSDVKVSFYA